ncbi:MAG: hypothetical protein WBQ34_02780 [Candidatus Acidiferrales bacterium]
MPVVIPEGTQGLKLAVAPAEDERQAPSNSSSIALTHRPAANTNLDADSRQSQPAPAQTIALTVPQSTPIQVVLEKDIRVRKVGQPIQGRVAEAIYSFDKLVIPANSKVIGKITAIQDISGARRAEAALNADFTPAHKVDVEFSELVLLNGRHIPIRTKVTPGSGQVVQFVAATGDQKSGFASDVAKRKQDAEHKAHQQWNAVFQQVQAPGIIHRLVRYALAELPFHPHYIDARTVYFAELKRPLIFGNEPLTPALAESISHPVLAQGSVVEARLLTPLNSATARWGDPVGAIVIKPAF